MKIIFLDFDGVITTPNCVKNGLWWFDPKPIKHLNTIIKETNCSIVVSSTWRWSSSIDELRTMFKDNNISGHILDTTPKLNKKRGIEIKSWLDHHTPVETFVIIDDSIFDITPHFKSNCVFTDPKIGLTEKQAKRAIEFLNRALR